MTLNEAEIHDTVKVGSFDLDDQTVIRLQALGMIPGTKIEVLQKKGNGTLIINLRGTRFALGSFMTKKIEVEYA